ncbi:MAG: hypothetical protein DLM52_07280 [Chthoniobacterales bacterium]|nr:MAG: hypothetical protein DLM52_07280 [Chthoniobacterales bacterium]
MHFLSHAVHFLGIGAHKAGTTWLWSMLRAHPQIWTAPLKELHYFDRSLRYFSANTLAADRLFERLFSQARHNLEFRRDCRVQIARALHLRDWRLLRWTLRYYLGPRHDQWYLSLFGAGAGQVRGEITPAYAMLERHDVARVHRLLANAKIIFLLRNPIDRAWSHLRFEWMQGRFRAVDDIAQVRALLEHPGVTLRNDYLRTLRTWESAFPREQIFVGFYDDIVARPDVLLRDVFTFLEVEESVARTNKTVVLPSKKLPMPPEIRRYLTEKYLPAIEKLAMRFGGHAERWRAEASTIAGRSSATGIAGRDEKD